MRLYGLAAEGGGERGPKRRRWKRYRGLAVGEPTDKMYEMIEVVNDILPKDKPRYLTGVGTPINLLEGIERGIEDCIMPTRNGRNGQLFTRFGTINMRNKKWENDFSPVDRNGTFLRGYLIARLICTT